MKKTIIPFIFIISFFPVLAQENTLKLDLHDVIELALDQSPDSYLAKHRFRGKYWSYRTHKAQYLPSLNLNTDLVDYNRSIQKITLDDGQEAFVNQNINNSNLNLSINQNIGLTGGRFYISSSLYRINQFEDTISFSSNPINIGFYQPILGYNSLKWEKKIQPIIYEEAKRTLTTDFEQITINAINAFFDLAAAQLSLDIAKMNYSNTDTLYKVSQGRYQIGKIAQNDLLQMELSFLNSGIALNNAELELEIAEFELRSFLGYNDKVKIELIIPDDIPELKVDVQKAIQEAFNNNPELLSQKRQKIEAQRDVAKARAENIFSATLSANYGLSQVSGEIEDVFKDPSKSQSVSVGLSIPIIDWGEGRGKLKMARSNQEVTNIVVEQALIDFQQDIYLKVMQFNMQSDQLMIAAKADTIAQNRYEITKQRFLIGKVDVLNLNEALKDKDVKQKAYISSLRQYWNYYFSIRKLTLFDFEKQQPLISDIEKVLE